MLISIFTGCEKAQKKIKHIQSDYIGLNRKVEVYDYEGKLIKEYSGKFKVEIEGNVLSWVDDNNNEHKIIGGIVTIDEQ